MKRRCQAEGCLQVFVGTVCPRCGFDHEVPVVVTEEERHGGPSHTPAAVIQRDNVAMVRRTACVDCGHALAPGKGARQRCEPCRRRHRAKSSGRKLALRQTA